MPVLGYRHYEYICWYRMVPYFAYRRHGASKGATVPARGGVLHGIYTPLTLTLHVSLSSFNAAFESVVQLFGTQLSGARKNAVEASPHASDFPRCIRIVVEVQP